MIISISVPATGFFTCKAFLFLFLSNKWISSQAVIPAWLGLAGHDWSGKGSTAACPHQDTVPGLCIFRSWRHTPVGLMLCTCEQFIMGGKASVVGRLWAFMSMCTCWAAALVSLCFIAPATGTSELCIFVALTILPLARSSLRLFSQGRSIEFYFLKHCGFLAIADGRVWEGFGNYDGPWEDVGVLRRWKREEDLEKVGGSVRSFHWGNRWVVEISYSTYPPPQHCIPAQRSPGAWGFFFLHTPQQHPLHTSALRSGPWFCACSQFQWDAAVVQSRY